MSEPETDVQPAPPTPIPVVPPSPALTVPAFPPAYANPLGTDAKLDQALDDAIKAGPGKSWKSAVAIVALNDDDTRPLASFRGDEVHYSASFVKVAAMYAAYELLATMNKVAIEYGKPNVSAFYADAAAYLNALILAKAATIPGLSGLQNANAVPSYSFNYDATPNSSGILELKLNAKYEANLLRMIQVSNNTDAAWCIHRVGYGYLNGALTEAGFFDASTNNGIWLAGDYLEKPFPKDLAKWPYLLISSVNDGDVAQAITVDKTARFLTLIWNRKLVDGPSSEAMLKLLKAAADVPEVWITRTPGLSFKVPYNKLGFGPLKSGPNIYSEGSILKHNATGRRFVAVWQNFTPVRTTTPFAVISNLVNRTIKAYLTP